jgi:hypothetical protein
LGAVSGGGTFGCFFTPSGDKKVEGGHTWLKCASSCNTLCECHGCDQCQGKWHKIHDDYWLLPFSYSNHSSKNPGRDFHT